MGDLIVSVLAAIATYFLFVGLYKWCEKNGWLGGPHFLDL